MNPAVSIVTPVYNRPKLVCSTIDSVMQQAFPNWEHIVVDDRSTDNTWQVISEYSQKDDRILTLKRDREPKGAQTCRNIGLNHAKGKYIVLLDSDDILMPFCLEQRMDFVAKHPNIDLAVFPKNIKKYNLNNLLICFLSYKLPLQTTDSLWNKSFLFRIGGLNENLQRFQDVELSIKALLQDNVNLLISDKHLPDSQYLYSSDVSEGSNDVVVYNGLRNLIAEVSSLLEKKDLTKLKPYLRFYLRSWLIHYQSQNNTQLTNELISYFRNKEIISKKLYNLLILSVKLRPIITLRLKLYSKLNYYSLFIIK